MTMDEQIINGNGTSPNVNGYLSELTDASAETTTDTYDSFVKKAANGIDGIYADSLSQVTQLVGVHTKQHAIVTKATSTDSSADDKLTSRLGGFTASAAFGRLGSNKRQRGIMYRMGGNGPNAHAAVWSGIRFYRDELSMSKSGQVGLTALMLWNFKIVRETPYTMLDYKLVD